MKKFLAVFFVLLLTACAANGPGPVKVDQADILIQLARLPGVEIVNAEDITFAYPGSVLFAPEAVLPLPGGVRLLDPLVDFFQANRGLAWKVDVRAITSQGVEYDLLLAEKRSELLETYLLNNGVTLAGFQFNPLAAEGHPLVFTLTPPQQTEKP